MIVKGLLAGALSLAFSPPQPAFSDPITYTTHPFVEKVKCLGGSGTAFKLADGRWASVNHVTEMTGCKIDGLPIVVTHSDSAGDFSLLDVPGDTRKGGIEISCAGYSERQWYYPIGHARGDPFPQIMAIRYSAALTALAGRGVWAAFDGWFYIIPGMSGGPVLDSTGRARGTNNAYNPYFRFSYSRPLSETILCRNSTSAPA